MNTWPARGGPRYDVRMSEPDTTNKLLMAPQPTNGPVVGILMVVSVMLIGALYLGVDQLQRHREARNQIPYIPSSTTTVTIIKTSTTTYYTYSTTTDD